jgi:hypothetical protein
MTIHCPKCQALLMIVPSGAVCSRDPNCGGIIAFYDRKGIEAAWKQKRLESLLEAVPKAHQVEGQATHYNIGPNDKVFILETVINPSFIESKNYDQTKLQAAGMILAARQVRKGKFELCWFSPIHREAAVDLWDVPASSQPPKVTAPPVRDPNLASVAVCRVSRQALAVLDRLRRGPATNRELLDVAIRYGSRIHDLRKAGYTIDKQEDHKTGLTTYKLVGEPNE